MAARKAEVIITCDGAAAKQVLEGINRELQKAIKEREQLLQKQKQNGTLTQDEIKRDRELKKYIDSLTTAQQKSAQEMKKYADVMKDLAGSKTKNLKKALGEVKRALDNMSAKDPKRQQLVADLKRIQAQIDANTGAIKKQQSAWGSLGTTMKNLFAYAGVFAGFNKLKSMVEGVFKANMKLSDSLADIRKVSGLSMESINQLYRNISAIDSRNTIETLNKLAYTGAKLGIGQNYGVEGLTGFVKAAEQVQMALGEDMGEDALPALAKMTEVMGLIDKYGVEQSMQKAASAIFQLGATSTATGTNIVEFSKRLYGLANVSRVSTDDLLALGSAADAMGLMPEVAATAFNKLFTSVQRQHNLIEQSLGMEKGRIKELYDEGKTMDAIVEIFDKMNQKGNLNLLGSVFKDLGSDGARLVNVMATMADRVDILKKHLITSRDAFKEGEAVIGEYMIQNQTAQAMMERSANLWAKAFTNPEGVDMVKQMAQAWYDVSKSMTQSDAQMKSLHNSINIIAVAIETLIKLLPFLIRGLMMFGVAAAVRGVVMGVGGLVTAIRTATTAQIALNTAMKSNWFLAIVSAIGAALTLLYDYAKAAEEAAERETKRQAELKAAFENSREAVDSVVKPLEVYKKSLDDASLSEKQRMELVKQFKDTYQDYLDYLGLEITSAVDLAKAYSQVVRVMKQKKAYEERESFRQQKNGDNRMSRIEKQAQVEAQLHSMGITGIDKKWLEQNQHLDTKGVYDKIMRQQYGMGAWEVKGTGRGRWAIRDSKGKIKEVGSEALYDIIGDYISAYRTERDTNKQIDAMFNSEYKDIDLEHFDIDEFNDRVQRARWKRKGSLDNEKPDKGAIAAAKKAAADRKQALRKELQDAQRDSDAIISKIEEWYRLQETIITSYAADGTWTQKQADMMIAQLNMAKNQALADARRGISGRDEKSWEITKQRIGDLMFDTSDMSQHLLDDILKVKLENVRTALGNIDKAGVEGISSTAMRDKLNKNAAGNDREVQRILNNSTKEVEKMLKQYDFLQQAIDQFDNRLTQLGLLTESARAAAKRIQDAANANPAETLKPGYTAPATEEDIQRQRRQSIATAAMKFIQNGTKSMAVNYEDSNELAEWLRELTEATVSIGQNGMEFHFSSWAETFQEDFDKWLRNSSRYKQEIQAFYLSLVDAEDNYYKKRKESYNFEKQQQEQRFRAAGYTDEEERTTTALENQAKVRDTGIGATFWEQQGLGSIAEDPEVLLIQKRMEWRAREVADIEQQLAQKEAAWAEERAARIAAGEDEAAIDAEFAQRRMGLEDLLKERQTALLDTQISMATKISQEMQKRVQTINSLTKPIQDGAQKIGKKFGEMIRGVEDDSLTWKEVWQSMAQAVGDSIIDMMAQYAQNMIMEKMMNDQSKSEALSKAQVDVAAGTASAAAKTVGQLGWWGLALIPVIAAVLHGLLAAAFASNNSNNTNSPAKKVKLASGMLTYDEGNVQTVVGDDGRVYKARSQKSLPSGVSMITEPIATTVNGQQALVGERGPEIVIGRKTTRAIQMNRPDLLRDLVMFDKGMTTRKTRTFDEGNLSDLASAIRPTDTPSGQATSQQQTDLTSEDARALTAAIGVFAQTIAAMQKNGIPAKIQKYGTGGLIDEVQSGLKFVSKYK